MIILNNTQKQPDSVWHPTYRLSISALNERGGDGISFLTRLQ